MIFTLLHRRKLHVVAVIPRKDIVVRPWHLHDDIAEGHIERRKQLVSRSGPLDRRTIRVIGNALGLGLLELTSRFIPMVLQFHRGQPNKAHTSVGDSANAVHDLLLTGP